MIYAENHEPEEHISGEILFAWIFAIGLVGVVLLVVSLAD